MYVLYDLKPRYFYQDNHIEIFYKLIYSNIHQNKNSIMVKKQ